MSDIYFLNRRTNKIEKEKVYGQFFIQLLYGNGKGRRLFSPLLHLICRFSIFSKFYGFLQKRKSSKRKIRPFVEKYQMDASEFLQPIDSFRSFNDFFIRKLKPEARPIASGEKTAVLPADGRYFAFESFPEKEGVWIKGACFSLGKLLEDARLAEEYKEGPMLIARLCPVDYHRFHFPCDCIPSKPQEIKGRLYSVNPLALKKNIHYLTENKRVITKLSTEHFGDILYIEIGATYVGSIRQTYLPEVPQAKGAEKGYFEFGGSCLILLFPPESIRFDQDLVQSTKEGLEVLGRLGQSLGTSH